MQSLLIFSGSVGLVGAGRGIISASLALLLLVILPWYGAQAISDEDVELSINIGLLMFIGVFIAAVSLVKQLSEAPWSGFLGIVRSILYIMYLFFVMYDFSVETTFDDRDASASVDFTLFFFLLVIGFVLLIATDLSEIIMGTKEEEEPVLAGATPPSKLITGGKEGLPPPPTELRSFVVENLTKAKNDFEVGKFILTVLTSYTVLYQALTHYWAVKEKKKKIEEGAKKLGLSQEICKGIRELRRLRKKIEEEDYEPSEREAGDSLELAIKALTELGVLAI